MIYSDNSQTRLLTTNLFYQIMHNIAMRVNRYQIGAMLFNLILIILLFVQKQLEFTSLSGYNDDYTITSTTGLGINNVINLSFSFVFVIFLFKPDKRIINQMKYWQLYLALYTLNTFIRYFFINLVQTSAILWSNWIFGFASIFKRNKEYVYISLGISILYLIFSLSLHYYSKETKEDYNKYTSFLAGITDKLIFAFLMFSVLSYRAISILTEPNQVLDLFFEIYFNLIVPMFIGFGILTLKFNLTEKTQVVNKQFILEKVAFLIIFPLLFIVLLYVDSLLHASDYEISRYLKVLPELMISIMIYIVGGFVIDLILKIIFKLKYQTILSRVIRIIKSYMVIISIIGILLWSPIIINSFSHSYEYGNIYFDVESKEGNTLKTQIYFDSNHLLFQLGMEETNNITLIFSALMIFTKTDNGFLLDEIVNITSVTYNQVTTTISSNYSLLFYFSRTYDIQLTTEFPLEETNYVGLAIYRGDYMYYEYSMIAIFPELMLDLVN